MSDDKGAGVKHEARVVYLDPTKNDSVGELTLLYKGERLCSILNPTENEIAALTELVKDAAALAAAEAKLKACVEALEAAENWIWTNQEANEGGDELALLRTALAAAKEAKP